MVHRESRMRSLACKHDSVYDTLCACSNRSDALAFVIGKQTNRTASCVVCARAN